MGDSRLRRSVTTIAPSAPRVGRGARGPGSGGPSSRVKNGAGRRVLPTRPPTLIRRGPTGVPRISRLPIIRAPGPSGAITYGRAIGAEPRGRHVASFAPPSFPLAISVTGVAITRTVSVTLAVFPTRGRDRRVIQARCSLLGLVALGTACNRAVRLAVLVHPLQPEAAPLQR